MAKNLISNIASPDDLVTSREETRAGFIAMAIEKNYMAVPYIEEAKALKALASSVGKPMDLLLEKDIRVGLLTASGLSDKSLKFLTEDDKILAIKGLIEKFLEPAGSNFVDELIYRYLLTKGDALGGKARNLAGSLGELKFLKSLISVLKIRGIKFYWKENIHNKWVNTFTEDPDIYRLIKGVYWRDSKDRLLLLNAKVPIIDKNVDLILLNSDPNRIGMGRKSDIYHPEKYVALGELKGGIDPAGADEHWKTANSALNRIRAGFEKQNLAPATFFIGAAIESAMANEIFNQLTFGKMTAAANLTNDIQLSNICSWLTKL